MIIPIERLQNRLSELRNGGTIWDNITIEVVCSLMRDVGENEVCEIDVAQVIERLKPLLKTN